MPKFICDILIHFQTPCCGVTQIKSVGQFRKWFIALKLCLWMEVWMACLEANNVDWHTCHQQLIACSLSATITHLSIGNWTKVYTRVLLETERFTLMKCEIPNYHLSFTQIKPIENRWLPLGWKLFGMQTEKLQQFLMASEMQKKLQSDP